MIGILIFVTAILIGVGTKILLDDDIPNRRGWIVIAISIPLVIVIYWMTTDSTSASTVGTDSFWKAPTFETVWEFAKNYWLWILVLLAAAMFGTMFVPATPVGLKKGAQLLLGAIAILFFIAAPVGTWIHKATLPTVTCQDASAQETRSCILNSSWTAPLVPSSSEKVAGMRLCSSPDTGTVSEMKLTRNSVFWRFRATDGDITMRYRLMANCPTGDLPP